MKYHISFDIELRKNRYKGLYIAFEGIDGVGKTTQANIVATQLRKKGKEVIITKEPTKNPPIGKLIHDFLKGKIKLPEVSVQYLFAADREIHQQELIEPALKAGTVVIADRCFWSSVAYGILDKKEDFSKLKNAEVLLVSKSILSFYHQFIVPDITFYIQVSSKTALKRLASIKRKREYYETDEKLAGIKMGYDWLARKFPDHIVTINGEKPVGEVTGDIIKQLKLPK